MLYFLAFLGRVFISSSQIFFGSKWQFCSPTKPAEAKPPTSDFNASMDAHHHSTPRKKFKITAALKEIRSKPGRKVASLGRLCHEVGWQYRDVVGRLEAKRLANAQEWYNKKQAKLSKAKAQAKAANTAAVDAQLAEMGY